MTYPFRNSIVGADGALVRPAIKSPDYVPGVSGWSINKDGTAEFNDATIRGELEVGDLIKIGDTLPDALSTFYVPGFMSAISDASILMYPDGVNYAYTVTGVDTSVSPNILRQAFGWTTNNGTKVIEAFEIVSNVNGDFMTITAGSLQGDTEARFWNFGTTGGVNNGGPNAVYTLQNTDWTLGTDPSPGNDSGSGTINNPVTFMAGMAWDGTELGRGVIAFEPITAALPSGNPANTEQVMYTTALGPNAGVYHFLAGRAYLVELVGQVESAAVQRARFDIVKGTVVGGTHLVTPASMNIDTISTDVPVYVQGVFVNTSGATVPSRISVTFSHTAATLIRFDGAAAPTNTYLRITDIGDTSVYSGVSV